MVAMATQLLSSELFGICFNVPRKSHAKYELNTCKDKEKKLLRYHRSCHDNLVAIAISMQLTSIVPRNLNAKYKLCRI